jgi:hypothetical protein
MQGNFSVSIKGASPCWNMNPTPIVYKHLVDNPDTVWAFDGVSGMYAVNQIWNAVDGFPHNTVNNNGEGMGDQPTAHVSFQFGVQNCKVLVGTAAEQMCHTINTDGDAECAAPYLDDQSIDQCTEGADKLDRPPIPPCV